MMKKEGLVTRIVLLFNWLLGAIFFHLFNFTGVYNRKGLLRETGILFVASHFTMVDSWLIGTYFSPLDLLLKPQLIPYNVPEKSNFYKRRLVVWWLNHSKCLPILRTSGGRETHQKIKEALQSSNVLIFPESTRRRQNQPIKTNASVGKLIAGCKAKKIIPIRLMGLPYKGSFLPVLFRRIKVVVGRPLKLEGLATATSKGDYEAIFKQVMEGIENLLLQRS